MSRSSFLSRGCLAALAFAACAAPPPAPLEPHEGLTLEGAELLEALDRTQTSGVLALAAAPLRVGLLWDGPDADALELRFSADAEGWTRWEVPQSVHDEDLAHAGFADPPDGARFAQWRVRDGKRPPTFLRLEEFETLGDVAKTALPELEPPPVAQPGARRDFLAAFPNILPRSAWGARAPTCVTATNPYRSVIHHTASPTNDSMTPEQRLRQTQSYHMDTRGYCDIAYNYLVSRDARVWTGRGATVLGGHTLNENSGNVAICYLGNYVGDQPSDAQICAGAGMLAWLNVNHGVAFSTLKGHRDYGQTACPGDLLYARLTEMKTKAQSGCAPQPPAYAAQFVSQTFPLAQVAALELYEGEEKQGSITFKNVGAATWKPATTRIAPIPRDVASPLAASGWIAPHRAAGVAATTAPGANGTFTFRLKGGAVGESTQAFGLLEEGVVWFADQGGPEDNVIKVRVKVVARPPSGNGGGGGGAGGGGGGGGGGELPPPQTPPAEAAAITLLRADGPLEAATAGSASGGCSSAPGALFAALAVLAVRRRRRPLSHS